MRLWSIHPKYLDQKGLVTLWREALLAQKVLQGKTRGYKNHPQLIRFKQYPFPISAIGYYLYHVQKEGGKRGYKFKKEKICSPVTRIKSIPVSDKQLEFEFNHLMIKFKKRAQKTYKAIGKVKKISPHPLFKIKKGKIESWEKK